MFINVDLFFIFFKVIEKIEIVKVIVYDGEVDFKIIEDLKNVREGMKVVILDEVVEIGKKNFVEVIKVNREEVYCCMYISGFSEFVLVFVVIEVDCVYLIYSWYIKGCVFDVW